MPRTALRKGSKMDNVDCAFSAFPLTPTNVPLLVYNFWEADRETDKREYGAPRTSNRASAGSVDASIEFPRTSPVSIGDSIVGVALIWIALRA